ncbi:MAG: dUTP diphosphatase [Thermoplasmata archaeon]
MDIKIKIWKKDKRAQLPERSTLGSVGFDLFALEDTTIYPLQFTLIRTGLVIQTQFPYAMLIFPRSSLFKKKNLIMPNSVGIIDFDYCGEEDEIKIPVLNLSNKVITIQASEKIAQAVFVKIAFPEIIEISEVSKQSRGGFGSTGGYQNNIKEGNNEKKS